MTGILTIEQQIRAMEAWAEFALTARDGHRATWRGQLRPYFQTFAVEIAYRAPAVIELLDNRIMQPRVRILSPPLRIRKGDPEGQLPHVYYTGPRSLDVVLCMFDPESDEWSTAMSLAETTVPWTIDWIASYEGWRATGEWTGGGKHLGQPTIEGAVS